jgi:hypothetical protein
MLRNSAGTTDAAARIVSCADRSHARAPAALDKIAGPKQAPQSVLLRQFGIGAADPRRHAGIAVDAYEAQVVSLQTFLQIRNRAREIEGGKRFGQQCCLALCNMRRGNRIFGAYCSAGQTHYGDQEAVAWM